MGLISGLFGNAGVVNPEKLEEKYGRLLCEGECFEVGFQVVRDMFVFTNKRLIFIDIQGLTGRKTEYLSIPYSKITRYSIETAGTFDLDAELKIWVSSASEPIAKKFNKKVDVYEVQKVLSTFVL